MPPVEGAGVLPEPMFGQLCVLDDEPDEPLFDDVPDPLDARGVETVSVGVNSPGEVVGELIVPTVAAEILRPGLSPTSLAAIPPANWGRLNFCSGALKPWRSPCSAYRPP